MLKQSSNGMKKGLAILLAVLFIVSLTAVSASAYGGNHRHSGHGHYGGHGRYGGWGWGYGGWGYGTGCTVDPITGAIICPTYGYPYL